VIHLAEARWLRAHTYAASADTWSGVSCVPSIGGMRLRYCLALIHLRLYSAAGCFPLRTCECSLNERAGGIINPALLHVPAIPLFCKILTTATPVLCPAFRRRVRCHLVRSAHYRCQNVRCYFTQFSKQPTRRFFLSLGIHVFRLPAESSAAPTATTASAPAAATSAKPSPTVACTTSAPSPA
jgi:hypothetical protein